MHINCGSPRAAINGGGSEVCLEGNFASEAIIDAAAVWLALH